MSPTYISLVCLEGVLAPLQGARAPSLVGQRAVTVQHLLQEFHDKLVQLYRVRGAHVGKDAQPGLRGAGGGRHLDGVAVRLQKIFR